MLKGIQLYEDILTDRLALCKQECRRMLQGKPTIYEREFTPKRKPPDAMMSGGFRKGIIEP